MDGNQRDQPPSSHKMRWYDTATMPQERTITTQEKALALWYRLVLLNSPTILETFVKSTDPYKLDQVETSITVDELDTSFLWVSSDFRLAVTKDLPFNQLIKSLEKHIGAAIQTQVVGLVWPVVLAATRVKADYSQVEDVKIDPTKWHQTTRQIVEEVRFFFAQGIELLNQVGTRPADSAEHSWQLFIRWHQQARAYGISDLDLDLLISLTAYASPQVEVLAARDLGFIRKK